MLFAQTVRQVLRSKGLTTITSISPDSTVAEALRRMASENVGAMLVVEHGRIVGIISERDYARKILLSGKSSRFTKVSEIMTSKVLYVAPDDPIDGVLALMTNKQVRHMPVLEDEKLIGFLSLGDIVKAVLSDQEFVIDQLVHYISGSDYGWHQPSSISKVSIQERQIDNETVLPKAV